MRVLALAALSASAISLASCADGATGLAPRGGGAFATELAATSLPMADVDISLGSIALPPGASAEIRAHIYVNEAADPATCGPEKTALAVYGFAHTAATWGPLAEAMFAEPSSSICRIVAIDLPGHGASGLPVGERVAGAGNLLFGDLLLHDYASAVLGALDALGAQGIRPQALIAHSQGGMVVQIAQDRLVAQGSSLRQRFGIQEVTLLAPTMPAALPWAFADGPTAITLLSGLITGDATRGVYIAVPDHLWPVFFFSPTLTVPVAAAPSATDVASLGYNAPEPLNSALQLVGAVPGGRPAIARGIFAGVRGTRLVVVAFENDALVRPAEADALFSHLTADRNGHKFSVVTGPASVHDMFVSSPAELLAQIRPPLP